ncbi:hypothetical protein FRC07_007440 [Ceratobasidium sp. 392]|nr:hypothetical protein FRC07_007440 [Ceratobasidium sp. 392]
MDSLEATKEALRSYAAIREGSLGYLYIEGYADEIFVSAGTEDRQGATSRSTANKFLAAGQFFELLSVFEGVERPHSPKINEKQTYAYWRGAEILNALDGNCTPPHPLSSAHEGASLSSTSDPGAERLALLPHPSQLVDVFGLANGNRINSLPDPVYPPNMSVQPELYQIPYTTATSPTTCSTTNGTSVELASSRMINFTRQSFIAIAGGGFGDIYRGKLQDGTTVAIKALRHHILLQDAAPKALKRAMRELYTWSKAKHKNVQELLGVITFQGQLGMISLWMDNGNLEEYIQKCPDVDRRDLCSQVANGVAYLHGIGMVHGDLKARNVLVDQNGVARLSDFDHSILSNCTLLFTETTNVGGGTLRWMAPELLLSCEEDDATLTRRSKQTDVYALGMTMLEIVTGRVPYAEYKVDRTIIRALDKMQFPNRPKEVSSEWMWSLFEACWDHDPEARPPASWVCDQWVVIKLACQNAAT